MPCTDGTIKDQAQRSVVFPCAGYHSSLPKVLGFPPSPAHTERGFPPHKHLSKYGR